MGRSRIFQKGGGGRGVGWYLGVAESTGRAQKLLQVENWGLYVIENYY